jgi:hypothetical protein
VDSLKGFLSQNIIENHSHGHFMLLFISKCHRDALSWTFHVTFHLEMSSKTSLMDISCYFSSRNVIENQSHGHFMLLFISKCHRDALSWTFHVTFHLEMSSKTSLMDISCYFSSRNVIETLSHGHFTLNFNLICHRTPVS